MALQGSFTVLGPSDDTEWGRSPDPTMGFEHWDVALAIEFEVSSDVASIWIDTGTATTKLAEPQLGILAGRFEFEDFNAVVGYLQYHAFLIPLLFEAYEYIRATFAAQAAPRLRVSQDPDGEALSELVLAIRTDLPADQAIRLLDQFDDAWWLDAMPRAACRMTITLDYV